MKKIVRLTESDLRRVIKRIIREQGGDPSQQFASLIQSCSGVPAMPKTSTADIMGIISDIKDAVTGLGTDEEAVYDAFGRLRSKNEFCAVVNQYRRTGGEELFDAIDGDFSGDEYQNIVNIVSRLQVVSPGGR